MKRLAGILLLGAVAAAAARVPARVEFVYPLEGSLFPPEITAPRFEWRKPAVEVSRWRVEIEFAGGSRLGFDAGSEQSWRPGEGEWSEIKRRSAGRWAWLTAVGADAGGRIAARGGVRFQTSPDPVGAPIFYRDVPLMPARTKPGVIQPLPPDAIRLVAWRLREIGEPASRVLLTGLPTCANCHSFSRDGRTLGIDVDGPDSDKGTYALAAVAPKTAIRTEDVMTWNSFPGRISGRPTIGFMSQVSPDGRYVVSTVNESVYSVNFLDYRFLQVFYPTRGILAIYDRRSSRIEPLAGADDARYVHTGATWSSDGSYLVFSRADACDPYPEGRRLPAAANDPEELPVRYDLYRIPFNGGRGGKAQPVRGASGGPYSYSFPRISPDGRWMVFVRARNGLLMRPDSELFIVPAGGGAARRMRCNTPLMNSWHSFSPNGRWMVFSSKARSPYTEMFLTHIDADGNDSPAILIENSTPPERAVNLPEFVNIGPNGMLAMEVPAADFYRLYDRAMELMRAGAYERGAAMWRQAIALDPADPRGHNNLGVALNRLGRREEALASFERAVKLNPSYADAQSNLGALLWTLGRQEQALEAWKRAAQAPTGADAALLDMLAGAYAAAGRIEEARRTARRALGRAVMLNDTNRAEAIRARLRALEVR